MSRILGIDIGGTFTRYGIVEDDMVLFSKKIKTDSILDFAQFVIDLYDHSSNIQLISIGIPGVVKQNQIISVPNIKRLEDYPLVNLVSKNIAVTVRINKDVNLLFLNDLDKEALLERNNVIGIYLGTGLGNALYINGQLMIGDHGYSGELGHTSVIGNNRQCACGNIGCVETIVSGKRLLELYKDHNLEGNFKELFQIHSSHPVIVQFLDDFARIVSTEINLLDIRTVLLGGGVVNMKGFPREPLIDKIISYLRIESLKATLDIRIVTDDSNGSIKGAALIAKKGF